MTADLERLLDALRPVEARVSPDGSACAVIAGRAVLGTDQMYGAGLWLVRTSGSDLRRLDDGARDCSSPRWSHAGDAVAFAAGGLHVWRRTDERVMKCGDTDGAIEDIAWAADGKSIMMLVAETGSDTAGADTGRTVADPTATPPDPLVIRPAQAWRRLVLVDLAGRSQRIVSPTVVNVWEFDWHGGATAAAIVSDRPSEGAWFDAALVTLDVDHRKVRQLHQSTRQLAVPRLLDRGRHVAVIEGWSSDRGFVSGDVVLLDAERAAHPRRHPLEASSIVSLRGGSFAYAGWRSSGAMCGRCDVHGAVEELWQGDIAVNPGKAPAISVSDDGTVVAITEGPELPAEVRVLEDGRWRAITSFSPEVTAIRAAPIAWRGRDGLEIEGLVLRPHGRPAPLIVDVHGGPTDAWSVAFAHYGHQTLLRRGYALLLPNPRGSCGRGTRFLEAVVGDPGGEDLWDILAGVERSIAAGIAEPSRIGIMGGSYGGFMAAWATTQTRRFRAAVSLAPVTDWRSFHFTSNIGRFDELLLSSDPRDPAGAHASRSPLTHAHRSATPTLLIHGELDRCTPPTQSEQFYNALAEAGVETELVVYPREGHGWRERAHHVDVWRRIGDWFDRYMN